MGIGERIGGKGRSRVGTELHKGLRAKGLVKETERPNGEEGRDEVLKAKVQTIILKHEYVKLISY